MATGPTASSSDHCSNHTLQADGTWCPMAHCSRNVTSVQHLPPLRRVTSVQEITDPLVSPSALFHYGAFSGETMAVCVYASPRHPALVAYDYQDGSILWTSPLEDLPGVTRRPVSGLLLAKIGINGNSSRSVVFAASPVEFVAYTADGARFWKRAATEITPAAPEGIGRPISLTFNDAQELITVTSRGWIIKLNPVDGATIDAYKMDSNVIVGDKVYRGTFLSPQAVVVVGNVLYLAAKFEAAAHSPLHPRLSPIYLVRIDLNQLAYQGRETAIKPLTCPTRPQDATPDRVAIGIHRVGGSPSAWITKQGKVQILANAETWMNRRLKPVIFLVEDDCGTLQVRWRSVLRTPPGDAIHAAPALHRESRTAIVTTPSAMFVFRDVDTLAGDVPSPAPLANARLLSGRTRMARVKAGSPFALTFDPEESEIVAYTNFVVAPAFGRRTYGVLGAFSLPVGELAGPPQPLWNHPLALNASGLPAPGVGTFGQPALFRYRRRHLDETGMIVNTVFSGTYIIK
jgi:hypothetical protein